MDISVRPWFTTGVALVGASAVAMAPVSPSWPVEDVHVATKAISSEVQLTDIEIPYILTLPIVRQSLRNWAENWAVYLSGLAQAGIGLVESLVAIPGVTVEIIQELLNLDFVGALETFGEAVRDSVIAVGQPLLDSVIWRNQKYLLVEAALSEARPQAIIDVANGFLDAGGGVATAFIQGTQDLVAAVLTFNLSNIADATIDGTRNFLISLGDGAGAIIDGIESAQRGIADALATEPPPPPTFDNSELRTPAVNATLALAAPFKSVALGAPAGSEKQTTVGTAVVDAATGPEAVDEPKPIAESDVSPGLDAETDSVDAPKKPVRATPVKDAVKRVETTVKRLSDRATAGVKKDTKDKDTENKRDGGADTKPASDAGDE
ncbi:hypothetical protein [Mycolicibacterium sp. XJ870]